MLIDSKKNTTRFYKMVIEYENASDGQRAGKLLDLLEFSLEAGGVGLTKALMDKYMTDEDGGASKRMFLAALKRGSKMGYECGEGCEALSGMSME